MITNHNPTFQSAKTILRVLGIKSGEMATKFMYYSVNLQFMAQESCYFHMMALTVYEFLPFTSFTEKNLANLQNDLYGYHQLTVCERGQRDSEGTHGLTLHRVTQRGLGGLGLNQAKVNRKKQMPKQGNGKMSNCITITGSRNYTFFNFLLYYCNFLLYMSPYFLKHILIK